MLSQAKSAESAGATDPSPKGEGMRVGGRGGRTALFASLIAALCGTLLVSCGGGGNAPGDGADESESESEAENGLESEAEAESESEDCDDEVDCTDDSWNNLTGACANAPLNGRCPQGQICHPSEGCTMPQICTRDADCEDLDNSPCMQEFCNVGSAACDWQPLDADGDGHTPQICAAIGGDDCDDRPITPKGCYDLGLRCEEDGSLVYPGAEEFCDGLDNNCDGKVDEGVVDQPCENDQGLCGAQTCLAGQWSSCTISDACDPVAQTGCSEETSCYIVGISETTGAILGCVCEGSTGRQGDPCDFPTPLTQGCAPGYHCDIVHAWCTQICHRGSTDECPAGTECRAFVGGTTDQPFALCW